MNAVGNIGQRLAEIAGHAGKAGRNAVAGATGPSQQSGLFAANAGSAARAAVTESTNLANDAVTDLSHKFNEVADQVRTVLGDAVPVPTVDLSEALRKLIASK